METVLWDSTGAVPEDEDVFFVEEFRFIGCKLSMVLSGM
jgi:hypothetical protein